MDLQHENTPYCFQPVFPHILFFLPTRYDLMVIGSGHGHELFCSPVPQSWVLGLSWLLFIVHHNIIMMFAEAETLE